MAFSVGKQGFVILSLTMAASYALGFLSYGIAIVRTGSALGRPGLLLTAGGLLLLLPVVAGVLELSTVIVIPAWMVLATLGLVAVDTAAVGLSLRSAS
ncbi:MAG: hypothetical protein ABEI98_05165 [Halorhabdus sp.]